MVTISRPLLYALIIVILVLGIVALPLAYRQYLVSCSEPKEVATLAFKVCITIHIGLLIIIATGLLVIWLKER